MNKQNFGIKLPAKLQMRAEDFLSKNLSAIKKIPPRKVRNLFEDFQIYQTELETRNEELSIAQRELKAALDRYSDLYEFAPVGYFTINDLGMIVDANLTGATFLEEERSSLIGMPFSSFISKDTQETFELLRNDLEKKEAKQRCELKLERKDKAELFCQLECSISQSRDGEFKQIRMAVTDISELKRLEETLRKNEIKLKTIFENANDEIIYMDLDGTILEVNKKVEDIFGYSPKEVVGKKYYEVEPYRGDNLQEVDSLVKTLTGGPAALRQFASKRKDGSEVIVETNTSLIKEDGETINILSVIRDISDRKSAEDEKVRLEARLQQTRRMEAMDTFAGGIAHEFNNLLGIILGNAELALDVIEASDPVQRNLKEMKTATLRARNVVKQILAYRRKIKMELKTVRIGRVIEENIKMIRSLSPAGIEISHSILSQDDKVYADSTQIEQILINLCSNALDAMGEGGSLKITVEDYELDEGSLVDYYDLKAGRYVRLSVSDNGHGMDNDVMERIFDPYFSTKEKDEYSGMGLAVTYGIVKKHGGDIAVESAPGRGTVIRVLLPVIADDDNPKAEPVRHIAKGNERILFVDDENKLVITVKDNLRKFGYKIDAESSSVEAMKSFLEHPGRYDLVITDMSMPDITGDIFAREILKIRPDIPIILCTGYSERISEEEAKKMGFSAFVMKPILTSEMTEIIRNVLDLKGH